jgi:hypothetical protein
MEQDHPLNVDKFPQGGHEKSENGKSWFASGDDLDTVEIELEDHTNNENQNDLSFVQEM